VLDEARAAIAYADICCIAIITLKSGNSKIMTHNQDRLWRIRIWLKFPQKIVPAEPPKKPGDLPQKIKFVDTYPEMSCLRSERLVVNLKRHDSDVQEKTNYLLECFTKGIDPKRTWDSISGTIELILDKLAFAFQAPIKSVRFEALDMTPPLAIENEREGLFGNNVPSIQKDTTMQIAEEWENKISPKLLNSNPEEMIEASIRWYAKGLTAFAIVDKFAFYWIALESLSMPTKPREKVFFRCQKCNHEIQECPECHNSSHHFPDTKERLKDLVVSKLGLSQNDFDSLWNARMMFHAGNKLSEGEVEQLADNAVKLKNVTLRALKLRLGLSGDESPVLISQGIAIFGEPFMGFRRELKKEDIQSFSEVKPLLKATLYKNTHFLG